MNKDSTHPQGLIAALWARLTNKSVVQGTSGTNKGTVHGYSGMNKSVVQSISGVNTSVVHGVWGERIATHWLRQKGFRILDRNVRPYKRDRRLEIDIISYEPATKTVVFVEVKQHKSFSPYQSRLRSIDNRKCRLLRRACMAWLRREHWQGAYRFDVIEIYGSPNSPDLPKVDHIERVRLFVPKANFVNWGD